jgi:hypothetical protein
LLEWGLLDVVSAVDSDPEEEDFAGSGVTALVGLASTGISRPEPELVGVDFDFEDEEPDAGDTLIGVATGVGVGEVRFVGEGEDGVACWAWTDGETARKRSVSTARAVIRKADTDNCGFFISGNGWIGIDRSRAPRPAGTWQRNEEG